MPKATTPTVYVLRGGLSEGGQWGSVWWTHSHSPGLSTRQVDPKAFLRAVLSPKPRSLDPLGASVLPLMCGH